jgi:hypothetical protein
MNLADSELQQIHDLHASAPRGGKHRFRRFDDLPDRRNINSCPGKHAALSAEVVLHVNDDYDRPGGVNAYRRMVSEVATRHYAPTVIVFPGLDDRNLRSDRSECPWVGCSNFVESAESESQVKIDE